tara:strand:+ start:7577 stop:8776 length:1200 start_codon:yes stop_codon:yes gene_type:complete
MSIPTNNLYDFVHQVLKSKFLLRYFYPWGEKRLENIIEHTDNSFNADFAETLVAGNLNPVRYVPMLLCHDQEPLDFELYDDHMLKLLDDDIQPLVKHGLKDLNLRWRFPRSSTDTWILLHSELNSNQVQKYNDTGLFKCAYWWSHAIIARDWYRFAEHDQRLNQSLPKIANWLVYARATSGKREYRQCFLDQLKTVKSAQLGSIDTSKAVSSDSSAEYDWKDYTQTNCSIILETVYDNRIHLTEKTLRPIACGHPFMILSGPGTLAYLRKMGFNTFGPLIDERYDLETDPDKRMQMVLEEMHRINNLSEGYQQYIWRECQAITTYNKNYFFGKKFQQSVVAELKENVNAVGMPIVDWKLVQKYHLMRDVNVRRAAPDRLSTIKLIKHLRSGGTVNDFVV